MRSVTYLAAASLDGFIAGPEGQVDWLFTDDDYGLSSFVAGIDTVLVGRGTYDFMVGQGFPSYPGMRNLVFSSTLRQEDHPEVEVVAEDPVPFVRALKAEPGSGIWLVGGGVLFRHLLAADLVDEVVASLHPILLGGGIPLLPAHDGMTRLRLVDVRPYDTGLVTLSYEVDRSA